MIWNECLREVLFLENIIISASVLSADLCELGRDIRRAEDAGCRYIHFDVMDGMFVPNISYGIPVLESVSKVARGVLDVHLMITDPIRYIKAFAKSGADIITFHFEACDDVKAVIDEIHSCGKKAGIAIKPATPASVLEPYIEMSEMLLVMTVEPGFGGQGFNYDMLPKIADLKKMISEKNADVPIQVDGGINDITAGLVKEAGAEILVAGSYLFKAPDMKEAVKKLM